MGLTKQVGGVLGAGIGALGGVLADTWKDYFVCDAMTADQLVCKGVQNQGNAVSIARVAITSSPPAL